MPLFIRIKIGFVQFVQWSISKKFFILCLINVKIFIFLTFLCSMSAFLKDFEHCWFVCSISHITSLVIDFFIEINLTFSYFSQFVICRILYLILVDNSHVYKHFYP